MPIVMKSGSLNLLETSGPVQACNGIALPFTFKSYVANNVIYSTDTAAINSYETDVYVKHFIVQLMHTNYKILRILK